MTQAKHRLLYAQDAILGHCQNGLAVGQMHWNIEGKVEIRSHPSTDFDLSNSSVPYFCSDSISDQRSPNLVLASVGSIPRNIFWSIVITFRRSIRLKMLRGITQNLISKSGGVL